MYFTLCNVYVIQKLISASEIVNVCVKKMEKVFYEGKTLEIEGINSENVTCTLTLV